MPLVTIITFTYNRPTLFAECAQAVLAQTYQDWVWWVVFNWEPGEKPQMYQWEPFNDARVIPIMFPLAKGDRAKIYIPSDMVNWTYPKVQTPYIYYLADDDLIDPNGLSVLVPAMGSPTDSARRFVGTRSAVYGRCEVIDQQPDGTYAHACWCYDAGDVGRGTGIDPDCRLDSGQVLHTKELWDRATADGWTLTTANAEAAHADGILLNRLAEFECFHYVPQRIVTHRRHAGAAHHRPQLIL